MTNKEAFAALTEEQIQSALEKAWENGECRSCGWHSSFYEVVNDLEPEDDTLDEWYTFCHSKDKDDSRHRGCFIYPDFKAEVSREDRRN